MNELLKGLLGAPELSDFTGYQLLLLVADLLYYSYFSVLLGGVTFALIYQKLGVQTDNSNLLRFARESFNKLFVNKWYGLLAGGLSLGIATAVRSWLIVGTESNAPSILFGSFVFLLLGISLAYSFQHYLSIDSVKSSLDSVQQENTTVVGTIGSAWGSLLSLIFSAWLYSAGTLLASTPSLWTGNQSFMALAFHGSTLTNLLLIVSVSLALTSAAIATKIFAKEKISGDKEYALFVGQRAIFICWSFILPVPALIATRMCTIPNEAINFWSIFFALLAIACFYGVFQATHALKNGSKIAFEKILYPVALLGVFFLVLINYNITNTGLNTHITETKIKLYQEKEVRTESDTAPLQLNRF